MIPGKTQLPKVLVTHFYKPTYGKTQQVISQLSAIFRLTKTIQLQLARRNKAEEWFYKALFVSNLI